MAFYDNAKHVRVSDKPNQYRELRSIGEAPGGPGIYKCQTCGFEDVINRKCDKLPPCSNCSPAKRANKWVYLVKATDK